MTDISATPLPMLAPRAPDSHKGDFGRVLLVGGSRGMSGAIALAGMGALRSGAGLVTLAVPEMCLDVVAGFEPSYMTIALPSDAAGRFAASAANKLHELAKNATAIAIGPGIGRSQELVEIVGELYQSVTAPMVVDADALNALSQRRELLARPGGPRVLTPHPGEFARLVDRAMNSRDEQLSLAHRCAADWRAVVVLKGHRTLVADGQRFAVNPTGNPGMATGGCGDVLTGVITALLCQPGEVADAGRGVRNATERANPRNATEGVPYSGLTPFEAARLGVWVHGRAGDLAAAELEQVSMIASDLLRFLPLAFKNLQSS
jgi:NAD(P)H-hydrate epimerase